MLSLPDTGKNNPLSRMYMKHRHEHQDFPAKNQALQC